LADSQDAILLQRRARRRLLGAIALVLFAVIVLPIIFDQEPRSVGQDLVIQIPSQDAGRFQPRGLNARGERPEPAKTAKTASRTPASDTPRAKTAPQTERFFVPLGAYTNRDNVKQLQARAAAAGFKTFTETVKAPKGEQLRVRAGPFPSREAADQARDKLQSQGLPAGAVVRQQP